MKYMGSKSRIAKYIVPILQECIDSNNVTTYIEPFVGGANIIDKIRCQERIGSWHKPVSDSIAQKSTRRKAFT